MLVVAVPETELYAMSSSRNRERHVARSQHTHCLVTSEATAARF